MPKDKKKRAPRERVPLLGGALIVAGAYAAAVSPGQDGGQSPLDAVESYLDGTQPTGITDAANNLKWNLLPDWLGGGPNGGTVDVILLGGALAAVGTKRIPGIRSLKLKTKHHVFAV